MSALVPEPSWSCGSRCLSDHLHHDDSSCVSAELCFESPPNVLAMRRGVIAAKAMACEGQGGMNLRYGGRCACVVEVISNASWNMGWSTSRSVAQVTSQPPGAWLERCSRDPLEIIRARSENGET